MSIDEGKGQSPAEQKESKRYANVYAGQDICETVRRKLREIEEQEHVKILYAVESGSRAWGVASPDSDYDVRFVYVRRLEDYLSVREQRDVIEWQLDEVLDMNGWDLKKALAQFHRGNATLFEWANSPIVYLTTQEWQTVDSGCRKFFSEKVALCHYYGTANGTFRQYLQGEQVRYKKYIYALRPLLACKFITEHHTIPPVLFDDLLRQELSGELRTEIAQMLLVKTQARECALHPKLPLIQQFIEESIIQYGQLSKLLPDDRNSDWAVLDELFEKIVLAHLRNC